MDSVVTLAEASGFILESNHIVAIVVVGAGILAGIVAIIAGAVASTHKTKVQEESRREVAAYVAEGSMTPEDAERLLNAGPKQRSC